jgi:hypothetical protein
MGIPQVHPAVCFEKSTLANISAKSSCLLGLDDGWFVEQHPIVSHFICIAVQISTINNRTAAFDTHPAAQVNIARVYNHEVRLRQTAKAS